MKLNVFLTVALQVAGGLATAIPDAEARCGDLGAMTVPEGADASQFRSCLEHPLGARPQSSDLENRAPPMSSHDMTKRAEPVLRDDVTAQACWHGDPVGCTDGYCWKTCGDNGEWCWTALHEGTGPWYKCSASDQCHEYMACGVGSSCDSCGCSC
ncbi:hypothetical protein FQN54_007781 [Arachnomyces sp. PD_36]|nr:hypothetical protein FQN54_007781 [Arachnomyces sp. PD_36]